jgi:uncharacterized membrane protein YbhN (UPF0104 family)
MRRFLLRIISILFWTGVIVVGLFGIYFTFANYPPLGTAVALVVLLSIGAAERSRRGRQRTLERARERDRLRGRDPV